MPSLPANHLRSWDTETSVANSKRELEAILKRYRATGFTVSEDYASGRLFIGFTLPASLHIKGGESAEIRLPIAYAETRARLELIDAFKRRHPDWKHEQTIRVAWRHVVLWVEATLTAADARVQSLEEAFFAHTVIDTAQGRMNAIDAVRAARRLGSGK